MRNEQLRIESMYLGDYKSYEQMAYEETLGQIIEDNKESFQGLYKLFSDEDEAFDIMVKAIIILNDRTNPMLIKSKTRNSMSCTLDTAVTTFSTTAIGSEIPIVIVPAMHLSMYKHKVVQKNIEKCKG